MSRDRDPPNRLRSLPKEVKINTPVGLFAAPVPSGLKNDIRPLEDGRRRTKNAPFPNSVYAIRSFTAIGFNVPNLNERADGAMPAAFARDTRPRPGERSRFAAAARCVCIGGPVEYANDYRPAPGRSPSTLKSIWKLRPTVLPRDRCYGVNGYWVLWTGWKKESAKKIIIRLLSMKNRFFAVLVPPLYSWCGSSSVFID